MIGGGIAGWSAAWFARATGRSVVVVDAGIHRASDLPLALVNPLRGREGRIVPRGIAGMHATFALVDALVAAGHGVRHGRGVFRPLLDGASTDRAVWAARLPVNLAWRWRDPAPAALGLAHDVPAIELTEAGWLVPSSLLTALGSCGAETRIDEAVDIAMHPSGATVRLASGATLAADTVVWCGGAWGASRLDADDTGLYKPGRIATVSRRLTGEAIAAGFYAAPDAIAGTIVGPTADGSSSRFGTVDDPEAVRRLADRVSRLFGVTIPVSPAWSGVRLARLSASAARALAGVPTIAALGSRGFLLAPLLASEWAASL